MCPGGRRQSQAFGSNLDLLSLVQESSCDRLREAFYVLDRDGDGIIAASDLESFLQKVVASRLISKDDVGRMLALVEGDVDFAQFLRLLRVQPETTISESDEALKTMFQVLDKNGDGVVCSEDLKRVMKNADGLRRRPSETDIPSMLAVVGTRDKHTSERKVTYQDFVKFMSLSRPGNGFSPREIVRVR